MGELARRITLHKSMKDFFKRTLRVVAAMGLAIAMSVPMSQPIAAEPPDPQVIPGQFIAVVAPGASPGAVASRHGVAPSHVYTVALNGFAAAASDGQVAALRRDPDVEAVLPDRRIAAFPIDAKPWPLAVSQTLAGAVTGVNRIDAEGSTLGSAATNVAIIDTGSGPHSDLNVVRRVNCTQPGCPDGGNDGNGHGTHVAGTAAGLGGIGVARGVNISSVKVLSDSGGGSWSNVIAGVDKVTYWKQNLGGQWVANMSLGGSGKDYGNCGRLKSGLLIDALHLAICNSTKAGVVHVVAAGNSGQDAKGFVPAAYDQVITVSALADYDGKGGHAGSPTCNNYGADDTFATFSNYGADVDIAAPGVCITSAWPAIGTAPEGYNTINGTSMASPHVTGAVALKMAAGALSVGLSSDSMNARTQAMNSLGKVAQDDSSPYTACSFSETRDSFNEPMVYVGAPAAGCG